jgi:predicted helicase
MYQRVTVCANLFCSDFDERQPKWINNDYVKFIRFAQWRIEQTGYGILAFITDNSYLDGITFRGMRQSLMEAFDDIYLLDLHGNSNKKERNPDGSKDKNVFDIQQGVAISLFVKRKNGKKKATTVRHAHLWGVREIYEEDTHGERVLCGGKYHWLEQNEVSTTKWATLAPQSPFYLFIPQDVSLRAEYEQGWSLTDIMVVSNNGILTARDGLVIDFTDEPIKSRIRMFLDERLSDDEIKERLDLSENYMWRVADARKELSSVKNWEEKIQGFLYRPFDLRKILFHPAVVWRTRDSVMRHMIAGDNLGLIAARQTKDRWAVLATDVLCGHKTCAAYDINSLFPLYLYPDQAEKNLFDDDGPTDAPGGRRPNLAPEFIADFAARLKLTFIPDGKGDLTQTFGPEDVFEYLYAVFHAPTYRSRYAEFLKIDFPRLPLTAITELFRALCRLGEELVGLHVMEKHAPPMTSYPIAGDNTVEAVRYTEPGQGGAEQGRVWINKTQYFEGVPPEVWAFHVGGYQVCQKWLKDRKGRLLTYDDLTHYQRVVAALARTMELMAEIDETINAHGGWPMA